MIPAVEAKLFGYWCPKEGMVVDALVLEPAERLYRRQEAWHMWMNHRHWRAVHECFLPRMPT
jgi:hypothetical protein